MTANNAEKTVNGGDKAATEILVVAFTLACKRDHLGVAERTGSNDGPKAKGK